MLQELFHLIRGSVKALHFMDFPGDVDCLIVGTGLGESILSASLSILGKQVLHIDSYNYYGGRLASLRFPDLVSLLLSSAANGTSCVSTRGDVTPRNDVLQFEGSSTAPIVHTSSVWFVDSEHDGDKIPTSTSPFVPDAPIVMTAGVHTVPEAAELGAEAMVSDVNEQLSPETCSSPSPPASTMWDRRQIEDCMRRIDIDLLPKIIYADSPIVTAMLRSDVTRYLEFRSISRCLAHTYVPSCTTDTNQPESSSSISSTSAPCLVQIPVGRSELFKTRLLSLHQKRALGSFFECCFHLPTEKERQTTSGSVDSPLFHDYELYANRAFREWLQDRSRLDEFSRQLVTVNLAFANEETITREAVQRIRKLLLSMNRFGAHPLLWPLYGCGDLPQSFCRMSAVFGGVFCLNCGLDSVGPVEAELGDAVSHRTNTPAHPNAPRRFISRLSNNQEVRSSCVVIGAEYLPFQWVEPQLSRWYARAILLTDRSVHPVDRKPVDVSLLALPLSGRGSIPLDPALLLEVPVESVRTDRKELFIVHLSAVTTYPANAAQVFQPIIDRFFTVDYSPQDVVSNATDSNRPHLLWAGYFCLPDLSDINPLVPNATGTQFTPHNGFFLFPGPDSKFDLDATVVTAESVFRDVICLLGSRGDLSNASAPFADGGSDGPRLSTMMVTSTTSAPEYVSLDARWDGVFPPRPPNPEDLVIPDELHTDDPSSANE